MEISTSQLAVDLPGSGAFDPDSGVSAATAGEALPPAAAGTQQQTQHTIHAHRGRRPPPRRLPQKVLQNIRQF